jgi:hypothetical protein
MPRQAKISKKCPASHSTLSKKILHTDTGIGFSCVAAKGPACPALNTYPGAMLSSHPDAAPLLALIQAAQFLDLGTQAVVGATWDPSVPPCPAAAPFYCTLCSSALLIYMSCECIRQSG